MKNAFTFLVKREGVFFKSLGKLMATSATFVATAIAIATTMAASATTAFASEHVQHALDFFVGSRT